MKNKTSYKARKMVQVERIRVVGWKEVERRWSLIEFGEQRIRIGGGS